MAVTAARSDDPAGSALTPERAAARRRTGAAGRRRLWPFLVPSGIVVTAVLLYPLGYAIYLSLFRSFLDRGVGEFAGLGNYAELLSDPRFWSSLTRTIAIVAAAVGIEFWVGLLVAYGLYRLSHGAKFFNLLLFLPHIVTPVVAALFLKWIFAGRWGLLDSLFASFDLFAPDWLGSPGWARLTVILADAWQFTPFMILVLYAGLNTVDQSQIEAAQMDGAGGWIILFRIMLPAIQPLIIFVLAMRIMDGFRVFDAIYVLTAGGPGSATETITMYTYGLAFRLLQVGKAAALGVLTLVVILGFTAVMIALISRRDSGA